MLPVAPTAIWETCIVLILLFYFQTHLSPCVNAGAFGFNSQTGQIPTSVVTLESHNETFLPALHSRTSSEIGYKAVYQLRHQQGKSIRKQSDKQEISSALVNIHCNEKASRLINSLTAPATRPVTL